jgi:methylenetetrahydrofolate reductase (NADPH)
VSLSVREYSRRMRAKTPFSFEVYPPRSAAHQEELQRTIQKLAEVGPEYITVTYGANGSSRDSSLECVSYIRQNTSIDPLAHLTCVGSTKAEAEELVRQFYGAGIRSFLALRGDAPEGTTSGDDFLGELKTAAELVALIRGVSPYARIAVAAFPNGHPDSTRPGQDLEALLAKQEAGADFAITQLFFQADDYLGFVERARTAGVTIPLLPGIMPVITPTRLARIVEITGLDTPADLTAALAAADGKDAQRAVGVQHAVDLANAVLDGGAPGIHLYAFNEHQTVLEVLRRVGVIE